MISITAFGGGALDVVGLVLTVLGFAVTIAQVARAASAARAARDAAQAVAGRIGDLLLSSLLPRLRSAEAELRYARVKDDYELAVRAIAGWRDVLAETAGHLTRADSRAMPSRRWETCRYCSPRLVDLARRLREQTEIGRAAWKRAVRRDQYIYSARKGSVVIERADVAHVYTLRVLDPMGNEVEKFVVTPSDHGTR